MSSKKIADEELPKFVLSNNYWSSMNLSKAKSYVLVHSLKFGKSLGIILLIKKCLTSSEDLALNSSEIAFQEICGICFIETKSFSLSTRM